jgi:hypothetical protein
VQKRTQKAPPTELSADLAVGRIGVAYRATSELKLNAKNPRVHSQRQIRHRTQYRSFRIQRPDSG